MNDKELEQRAREIADKVWDDSIEHACSHCGVTDNAPYEAALTALQLKQKEVDALQTELSKMSKDVFGEVCGEILKTHEKDATITSLQERCERLEADIKIYKQCRVEGMFNTIKNKAEFKQALTETKADSAGDSDE